MPSQKQTKPNLNALNQNYQIETSHLSDVQTEQQYNQSLFAKSIEEAMTKDLFESKSVLGEKQKYQGSEEQIQTYEDLQTSDPSFLRYIIATYGSYDNYLASNRVKTHAFDLFDPRYDFQADITIITKEKFYKTDHISSAELIMEALSGKCTIDYLNKKGQAQRMYASLNKSIIPLDKAEERYQFFSPLRGNRIVLFNLVKQDWSSFYMSGLIRFVRDDTIGIE
jgi:hypothetical protein